VIILEKHTSGTPL